MPRIVVFLPSWLGDTAMATPTLRLLRASLERAVVVGMVRPGMDEVLSGLELLDDVIVADARKALGPAKAASRLVTMKFDACLLLPNSFSSAMTARLAGIRIRVGYDRDGRGMLLTHGIEPLKRLPPKHGYEPVSAVDYYLAAARRLLGVIADERPDLRTGIETARSTPIRLELATLPAEEDRAEAILGAAGVGAGEAFVVLNPGGNNPAKRWPVERFAAVAHHLIERHGAKVVINGSPSEAPVVALIRDAIVLNHPEDGERVTCLPELGGTVGSLKAMVRRARLMVTNDTGPRHIAAAFGVPCITLFGPTDPRWTTLPDSVQIGNTKARETVIVADPTLPPEEVADDHPERCRIDKIATATVIEAVDRAMAG